jgi:precorrin-6B methylase 2
MTQTSDVVEKLLSEVPVFHQGGTVRWDCRPETLRAIESFVRPGDRTLEVGCGSSTVVFTAAGAHHTSLSPDSDEHQRVLAFCEDQGIDASQLQFELGYSDQVLPELPNERTLDFALIDGSHSFPYPIVDWHYVLRMLKVGGRLLLDDVPVPAVAPLFKHMAAEDSFRLEGIYDRRAALFTLLSISESNDWTLQPFNESYPDYSFAPVLQSAKLHAIYRAEVYRHRLGERYPRVREIWRRTTGSGSR